MDYVTRVRRYLDINVLDAAKERIRHIFDIHDDVAVCFSGGKDSLAALNLTWEIAQERGLDQVSVVFWDEELIPDTVINFVEEYRAKPWVRMIYLAIPLQSQKYILGRSYEYIQWDPNREHVRPKPAHAITLEPGDDRIMSQYTLNEWLLPRFAGNKVAFLTGMRADESLIRYRASMAKLHDNYISEHKSFSVCKPLYDWSENDVFRYFYDRGIKYCPIYDAQNLSGGSFRVSTPLHAEAAKHIGLLRKIDPVFYQRVLDVFPEMLEQERYYRDLDDSHLEELYGQDLAGVRAYIYEHLDDEHQQELALSRVAAIEGRANQSAYPAWHVLRYIRGGAFKRSLLPIDEKKRGRDLDIR